MTLVYTTVEGDTVDRVMWLSYQKQSDALLRGIFDANAGLAQRGVVLPAGVRITIPDAGANTTPVPEVRLWD